MHFFITGHTGFKGSWLTLLLRTMGHEVSGFALNPVSGGLFDRADLSSDIKFDFRNDVRDLEALRQSIEQAAPDIAIHLAAQPLVLASYEDPIETYTTNVDGTRNFLLAVSDTESLKASLVVTTDKVYRDGGTGNYNEASPLGGHDPYSASKAMADIMTQSWADTNPHLRIKVARAGNVIGAFDVSGNRLIPDAIRALEKDSPLVIRHPSSIRPWQHVLDCLGGYVRFLSATAKGTELPTALNFGPDPSNITEVSRLVDEITSSHPRLRVETTESNTTQKETDYLTLDSSKAHSLLGWQNFLNFEDSVNWAIQGLDCRNPRGLVIEQINHFLLESDLSWDA